MATTSRKTISIADPSRAQLKNRLTKITNRRDRDAHAESAANSKSRFKFGNGLRLRLPRQNGYANTAGNFNAAAELARCVVVGA